MTSPTLVAPPPPVLPVPRRLSPQEPLVLLCIAAALLNRGSTKRVPDRHRAVLQAFAFLQEYSEARCVDRGRGGSRVERVLHAGGWL